MINGLTFREARADDAAEMLAVHYRSVHAIPDQLYAPRVKASWSPKPHVDREIWLASVIESTSTIVLVACREEEHIAGVIIYSKSGRMIQALYVDPEASGGGVGASLLRMLEERLEPGPVVVKASLNSVGFYSRMGFISRGRSEQRLNDGTNMPAVAMEKAVASNMISQRAD